MAPLTEPANPALEPSMIEVLRERRKNKPKQTGVKEKIVFNHTQRVMASIEHPFLVDDIDDALTRFGRNPEWGQLLDGDTQNTSVPFYFDRRLTGRPTMSSNVATNNILIKVTVPKRTGRRRKKGSNGPWLDPHEKRKLNEEGEEEQGQSPASKKSRQGGNVDQPAHTESAVVPPFGAPGGGAGKSFGFLSGYQATASNDIDDERSDFEKEQQRKRLYNQAQMMSPKKLIRILRDNVGRYKLEGVGNVTHTHRFRSLADFDMDMTNSRFMNNFIDKVMNGNIKTMREFRIETNPPAQPGGDIIAPPQFTNLALPFQYFYEQNPYVRVHAPENDAEFGSAGEEAYEDDDFRLVNVTKNKLLNKSFFISHNHVSVPMQPVAGYPPDNDSELLNLVIELQALLNQRPIWTRRSLFNQLGMDVRSWDLFKRAMQYVAYQFKSGPWHNAVIRFGVDPRTDPQYRKYQTMQFKLQRKGEQPVKRRHRHVATDPSTITPSSSRAGGRDEGTIYTYDDSDSGDAEPKPNRGTKRYYHDGNPNSHLFDGREYSSSGRVWQVCDITDPLLSRLLRTAEVRPTCSTDNSGWYHAGAWKKAKNIMRVKMIGIRFKKPVRDEDFDRVIHEYPDRTPPPDQKIPYFLLPNLHLTDEEMMQLQGDNRWRRNLRPGAGQKYIEKDGTVQVMSDKIPGYTAVFKGEEAGGYGRSGGGGDTRGAETVVRPLERRLGKDMTDLIDPALSSEQPDNKHDKPEDQQDNQPDPNYHGQQQGHRRHGGDSKPLNQDNVLAELSDNDSLHSNSDSDEDEEGGGVRQVGGKLGKEVAEDSDEEMNDEEDEEEIGLDDGYDDEEEEYDEGDDGFLYDGHEFQDEDEDDDYGIEIVPGGTSMHFSGSGPALGLGHGPGLIIAPPPPVARHEEEEGEQEKSPASAELEEQLWNEMSGRR